MAMQANCGHFEPITIGTVRVVSLNIGLCARTSLRGKPNRLGK